MRRRAFTLIELLVVMGIIAILIALPPARAAWAPGQPRGGSRASTTSSRSTWRSRATMTSYNTLPSGSYDTSGPVSSDAGRLRAVSWIVSLLPYMEQTGALPRFDFRYGAGDPENQTVAITRISR